MRDFVSMMLQTGLSQVQVHQVLLERLQNFSFRMGDSDANGPYASGTDQEKAQVKVWLGEYPATLTISLRGWRMEDPSRSQAKQQFWEKLASDVLPNLGNVLHIEERD